MADSLLNRFRKGAEKAAIQATAFAQTSANKIAHESKGFAQGFTLPGEAEKAANILESFLGGPYLAAPKHWSLRYPSSCHVVNSNSRRSAICTQFYPQSCSAACERCGVSILTIRSRLTVYSSRVGRVPSNCTWCTALWCRV